MRLTHAQLLTHLDDQYDVAGSAPWTTRQKVDALNKAYQLWFRQKAGATELTSQLRQQLRPLTLTVQRPATSAISNQVVLTDLTPPVYRILRVQGHWGSKTYPVRPVSFDQLDTWQHDPFNAPTNRFPLYTENRQEGQPGERLEVYSTTPVTFLTITYLHEPTAITLDTLSQTTEVDYDAQLDILSRAVAQLKLPADDFDGWQATTSDLNTN